MKNIIRRQLSLFVPPNEAEQIEYVRQTYNPLQSELIKSHVTLCRENEIENLDQIIQNLSQLPPGEISIDFGTILRSENGKGVLLPAQGSNMAYHNLRKQILSGLISNPDRPEPHITLMHPRNSTCTDSIFNLLKEIAFPNRLTFRKISLIEQVNGGKWEILKEFNLNDE
jgi:hypothetical protein